VTAVLETRQVVAGYVPDLPIVRGVSLHVAAGEVVTVIGPNGAGKSTLLKAIAGLVPLSAGSVRLRERDITGIRTHELTGAGVGYVPQTGNVFTTLTVHENLLVGAYRLAGDRAGRLEAVYALFPDLAARRRAPGRVLSGGQRQMLAIARALVIDPAVLLLDEATAGLAPRAAAEVFGRVRELAGRGVAVLMVEQNARAALEASDRGYVLSDGAARLQGAARDLLGDPAIAGIYLGGRRRGAP
jgi:branched-chain amino acid transport system ATP-binding protein